MVQIYWNSQKHIGIEIRELNGRQEISCLLDEDAWIDVRYGDGKNYLEASFSRRKDDGLEPYIRGLESGRPMSRNVRDWYFEHIFEKLNAWNWLIDPEVTTLPEECNGVDIYFT